METFFQPHITFNTTSTISTMAPSTAVAKQASAPQFEIDPDQVRKQSK